MEHNDNIREIQRLVANTGLNVQQLAVALDITERLAYVLKNKPLPSHLFMYGKKLEKLDIITHRNRDSIYLGSLMRRTGLTQVQIAAELDVSLRTVTYMRSPRRRHEVSKSLREALERLVEKCESADNDDAVDVGNTSMALEQLAK